MGFEVFNQDTSSSSSSTSSSSSGSSSSGSSSSRTTTKGLSLPSGTDPDDFPVFSIARPHAVIRKTGDGYEYESGVGVTSVEMKKTWYSAPWEHADHRPAEWVKVWWRQGGFRYTAHIVEDVTGHDLRELISDNPERAVDVINEASNKYNRDDSGWSDYRSCAVCDTELHKTYDEWKEVQNRAVCTHHTIEEVVESGLME